MRPNTSRLDPRDEVLLIANKRAMEQDKRICELEALRAELVEALREIAEAPGGWISRDMVERARAVLAKVQP